MRRPVSRSDAARVLVGLVCVSAVVLAGCDYRWTGGGTTNNWSDVANWEVYDPRGRTWDPATDPPDDNDDVYFNGNGVKDCVVDAPTQVNSFNIDAGYTGTVDVASDLGSSSFDLQDGVFSVGPGVTVTVLGGGSFDAGPGSSVVIAGTGLLPGEWASITGAGFSMTLEGDVSVYWARISGLDDGGLQLDSDTGATVFFEDVLFENSESTAGQYLNITGRAWQGYNFQGLAFAEVGAGPNTTGTVRIAIQGGPSAVTLTQYASSTPLWSSGDATDIEPGNDQVIWAPLAATLSDLSARRVGSVVAVEWTSLSERGTAGYHVWRAVKGVGAAAAAAPKAGRRALHGYGAWVRITRKPVPARLGGTGPRSYRCFDRAAPRAHGFAYMVEEISLHGRAGGGLLIKRVDVAPPDVLGVSGTARAAPMIRLGPAERSFRPSAPPPHAGKPGPPPHAARRGPTGPRGVPNAPSRVAEIMRERRRLMLELLAGRELVEPGTAKLLTSGEGIYEVPAGVVAAIDPSAGRLSHLGELRDLRRAGGALRFYAGDYRTRYSASNVLWLSPGASASGADLWGLLRDLARSRFFTRSGGEPPAAHVATVRVEKNEFYYGYYPDLAGGETDRWYFSYVMAPGWPLAVPVELSSPAPEGSARLRASLLGFSGDPEVAGDHHLVVEVNGEAVGETTWDGFSLEVVELEVPARLLGDGENTVTLRLPGDTGAWADWALLDWVEISYSRPLKAVDGRLRFDVDAPEGTLVSVSGFGSGDIEIVDVTSPRRTFLPPVGVTSSDDGYTVCFRTPAAGPRTYFAACAGSFGLAEVKPTAATGNLRADRGEIDYIAVGSAEMLEAAAALLDKREDGGLKVLTAELDDVIDDFGGGFYGPDAVRELVDYHRPEFLLLLGEGTLDFLGHSGELPASVVPNYIVSDGVAELGSDNLLGCVEGGDEIPEVAVGRLPAADAGELVSMVEKIIARVDGGGKYTLEYDSVVVADEGEPLFEEVIGEAADAFGPPCAEIRVGDYDGGADAKADFLDAASGGARTLVFFGHGSTDRWSSLNVLNVSDVAALECGNGYPVSLQFSCLTGDFASGTDSLGVAMMKTGGDGVSAVVASGGFSPSSDQAALARAMVARLGADGGVTLGKCLMEAKRAVGERRPSILRTFNLLGDPATE